MNHSAYAAPPGHSVTHPAIELLARYRAIFQVARRHRHELEVPNRLADEQAFLPAALSLQETPVHPAPRRIAYVLMTLFPIALAWAIQRKTGIAPDAACVIAEVTLENKDIGFVAEGQDVTIKLETFPFTRYGTQQSRIDKVFTFNGVGVVATYLVAACACSIGARRQLGNKNRHHFFAKPATSHAH